jgi:hypothetical protein
MSDLGQLRRHVTEPTRALAEWSTRDDSLPQAGKRRAANAGMDAIDALIGELYKIRAELGSEMRHHDDLAAVRVDALLEEGRRRDDP